MLPTGSLPTVNAILNGTSAVLLVAGYRYIRAQRTGAHAACMAAAVVTSGLFLVSYLVYHAQAGHVPFPGQGWARPVYFTILVSHTILAVAIVPLVLRTLWLAARRQFDRHTRLARWTLPLWLYVSVTGVVIYWMVYRVRWA